MNEFVLGVISSLVATAIAGGVIWYVRRPKIQLGTGVGGIWIQMVYRAGDEGYDGPIERIDVVRAQESLIRGRVRGVIYRIFDRRTEGERPELRSYHFRGRLSSGTECVHYWHVHGHGSEGVWIMMHNRDEKRGEYVRRNADKGVLERFPLRHVRPDSVKLRRILLEGDIVPMNLKPLESWPEWVDREFKEIESIRGAPADVA